MANRKVRRKQRSRRFTGIWLAILLALIGEMLLYTWCRVQCVRIGYEITQAVEGQRTLLTLQNQLKIELARLKAPERIARIAREQLGLTTPKSDQLVIVP